jgi:small GTP-binding protein
VKIGVSEKKQEEIYVQDKAGEIIYKVIVIGDPSIGKTSLIRKFVAQQFEGEYLPTVGTQISKQPVDMEIGGKQYRINLLLWDLAGQPQFYMLHKVYYNGANGVILGFDLTRSHTFVNVKNWHAELVKFGLSDVPIILTGNKADLKEERKVTGPHIDHMKEQLGIQEYIETSAKDGENVKKMFETIARLIYERKS